MTAVPAELTDEALLEALDFQPPCDLRRRHVHAPAPATLAVFAVVPAPCGCIPPRPIVLMCDACWAWYTDGTAIRCGGCGLITPFMLTVRKVVRL